MSDLPVEPWEERLQAAAREFAYPPTPNIAAALVKGPRGAIPGMRKRLWAAALVVVLVMSAAMLIPPVRAAVLEFLQIGVVRIFLAEPSPTPTPALPQETPAPTRSIVTIPLDSLLKLGGETSMERAARRVNFTIALPGYPENLGMPDRVYLQAQGGLVLILVWMDPEQADRVLLSLHEISPGSWTVEKMEPVVVEETLVNGQTAYWTEGPYPVLLSNGDLGFYRLVQGSVLIWEQGGITYRLESELTMEQAVKAAESLRPLPGETPQP